APCDNTTPRIQRDTVLIGYNTTAASSEETSSRRNRTAEASMYAPNDTISASPDSSRHTRPRSGISRCNPDTTRAARSLSTNAVTQCRTQRHNPGQPRLRPPHSPQIRNLPLQPRHHTGSTITFHQRSRRTSLPHHMSQPLGRSRRRHRYQHSTRRPHSKSELHPLLVITRHQKHPVALTHTSGHQTLGRGSHTRGELTGRNPLPILTHRHRKDLCMRIRGCRLIDQVAQPGQLPSPRTRSEADLTHAHLIPLPCRRRT